MNKGKIILVVVLAVIVLGGAGFATYYKFFGGYEAQDNFDVDSGFWKVLIKGDNPSKMSLKINNLKDYQRHFDVYFEGLDGFATSEVDSFDVDGDGVYYLNVEFKNPGSVGEGVYSGRLNILSEESSRQLPIILDVETSQVYFDASVELYPLDGVSPGGELTVDLDVNDVLKSGGLDVDMTYFIKDFSGEEIFSDSEMVFVDGRTQLTRSISIPMNIRPGDYVFGVVLNYEGSVGVASSFFRIVPPDTGTGWFEGNNLYIILAFGGVIFLFAIFVFYSVYSRERMFDEWKQEAIKELRRGGKGVKTVRISELKKEKKEKKEIKKESKKKEKKKKPEKSKKPVREKEDRVSSSKRLERKREIDELKSKLSDKLVSLQKAYDSGFISKDSYDKGSDRIKKLLRKA